MNKKLAISLLMALCGNASAAVTTYQLRVASVGLKAGTGVTTPPVETPKPSALTAVISKYAFADAEIGRQSSGQFAAFTNSGQVPLTLTGVTGLDGEFSGSGAGRTSCEPGDILQVGDKCRYYFEFAPTQEGLRVQNLTLTSDKGSATIHLSGLGVAAPVSLDLLSGPSGSIATVAEGATSGMGTHLYTFKNNSNKPLTATGVAVTTYIGTGGTISDNTCTSTVAPGGTCSLKLTPTAASGGTISLTFAESIKPTTVAYDIVVESTALRNPAPSLNGNMATWVLTNPNTVVAVDITALRITSGDSADRSAAFRVTGCIGARLAAKQSCTLTLEYLPASGLNLSVTVMPVAKSPGASGSTGFPGATLKWW
jgi:hypothetical protein